MERQTYKPPIQWIVVNDGSASYKYTKGQLVLLRPPIPQKAHSLCANLLFALPHVKYAKIAVLEDDDWIGPQYLDLLSNRLDSADLAGSAPAIYYNLALMRWRFMKNRRHASLGQTGFTESVMEYFRTIAMRGSPHIDLQLWSGYRGRKRIFNTGRQHVSMKSLPGELGIGVGHRMTSGRQDVHFSYLKSLIGPTDARIYMELFYDNNLDEYQQSMNRSQNSD
jgi:hypothetical protein